MATFVDSAIHDGSATAVTTFSTADALSVSVGSLVVLIVGHEGATATYDIVDNGGGTNLYTSAGSALRHSNGDLEGALFYWISDTSGTINPRVVLSAARTWTKIRAMSFDPASSKTFEIDGSQISAQGTSASPSAGTLNYSGAGVLVTGLALYGSHAPTAGSGWTRPAEFNPNASSFGQYALPTASGSITAAQTISGSEDWVILAASFKEVDVGGSPAPTITSQPQAASAAVGGTAQFSVVSSDATSYQWQVSTNRGISWSNVADGSGGTTATYTTPTAIASHNGRKYRCVLTNAGGNTNSFDVFFHVSGLGRAGRSTNRGFPDAQTFEGRLERSGAFAPGTWYAFRSISGINNRDFAAAARQAYFPELVIDPPSLAIWSNKLKAELPSKYGTPLSTLRQRGMPAALLVANNIVVGTLSVTNFGDIVVAAGTTTVLATLAKTNNNDTVSGNGNTTIVGTASATNTNDVVSASGTVTVIGNLAKTNADDTISATGSVGSSSTGSVNVTNQNDTLSAAGSPVTIGSGSTTNQNDTLAATGSSGSAVSGSLATTNANDTLSAAGTTTVTGSSSNTNNNDTVASTGNTTVVGSLSRTNNNDTLTASGASGTPPAGGSSTRLPLTGAGQT